MQSIAFILCTRNPRPEYLCRVLGAFGRLELPPGVVEPPPLVVVDNGSDPPMKASELRAIYPGTRVLVEPTLGLTNARLCGLRAAAEADWVLFLDDDNVLAPDYLVAGAGIIAEHPRLGCFGGSQLPEFEVEPSAAMEPFLPALALREVTRASWSNNYDFNTTPYGAGLWVRQDVARRYLQSTTEDHRKRALGRTGAGLAGCEDLDLAFTACDLGLACGVFPALRLTHLIPARRLELGYLRRLSYGSGYSDIVLRSIRFPGQVTKRALFQKLLEVVAGALLRSDPSAPRKNAFRRGQLRALLDQLRSRV